MRLTPNTIRAKLTLWHLVVMALVLATFALGIYAFVQESLFEQIDARLESNLAMIELTARTDTTELNEIERHTRVIAFRVMEGDWPLYVSGGWIAAELDSVTAPQGGARWIAKPAPGGIYHLREYTIEIGQRRLRLSTAENAEQLHRGLDRLALTLALGFPLALLLSLFGGYFLAGRMLVPLQNITARARTISESNLAARLPIANPQDELGQLGIVLNETFARLDVAFNRLKQFTQDAAHELRTPLTVMRSVGEVGLQEPRSSEAYREVIGSMLEEVDRLGQLVDGLLTLARAESGRSLVKLQTQDLCESCQEVVDCLHVLAEDKHQSLTLDAAAPIFTQVDRDTLRLALMNLVANAIRYTPAGGAIAVTLKMHQGHAQIEVQDNGPGIAEIHHQRVFERFYRVDPSRAQNSGGTGLGLAIARWSVTANGGTLELESSPAQGCLFRIVLPIAARDQTKTISD